MDTISSLFTLHSLCPCECLSFSFPRLFAHRVYRSSASRGNACVSRFPALFLGLRSDYSVLFLRFESVSGTGIALRLCRGATDFVSFASIAYSLAFFPCASRFITHSISRLLALFPRSYLLFLDFLHLFRRYLQSLGDASPFARSPAPYILPLLAEG